MDMMVSLLLSGVVAASPTTPIPWFQMEDYPVYAFQRRQQGDTAFELLVDPSGKPVNCLVVQSSGSPVLDRQACAVARQRARFSPARDNNGQAVFGTYRSKVLWTIDPEKWAQMETGPDLELNLSKLPSGTRKPIDVKFAYLIGADGRASSCESMSPGSAAVLDELGCKQLVAQARRAATSAGIGAAPVVQTTWIRFAPTD